MTPTWEAVKRMVLIAPMSFPSSLGFRNGTSSVHTSRTMMLDELSHLLDGVGPQATSGTYVAAIIEDNVLGKPTQATRKQSAGRLTELYGLNPTVTIFRLLRHFWPADLPSRPMLAFLAANARDALLRETTPFILAVPVGSDGAVRPEVAAIEQHRSLLADPDPVPGLADTLTSALRTALNDAHSQLKTEHETRWAALEATPTWQQLKPEQRYDLLSQAGVRELPGIAVGTPDELLTTLRQTKLSELHARCDALPTRFGNALAAAAKLLEPKAQHVSLPSATIKTDDDLKAWLADADKLIREKLKDGPVIL